MKLYMDSLQRDYPSNLFEFGSEEGKMQHDNGNPSTLNTTVTLSNSAFPDLEDLPDPCADEDEEPPGFGEELFSTSSLDKTFDLGNQTQFTLNVS